MFARDKNRLCRTLTASDTFAASAKHVRLCGTSVDFADLERGTCCLGPDLLGHKLQHANTDNCRSEISVPAHYAGESAGNLSILAPTAE